MRVSVLVLATVVCLDCGLTSAALAADMPVKARTYAPLVAPAYDWSGLYIGGNVGGGWSNRSLDIAGMAWHDLFSTEFIGGMQLGYNLHAGHFLVGVEGDLDWAGFTHPNLPIPTPVGPVLFSAKQNWISTVAARFGLTFDRWLAYGKVGGGWARDVAALNLPNGTGWTASSTNSGWLAGGGLEYGFKPNWTVKLEYDYLALGNWTTSTVPAGTWSRDVQMIKAGINYKFESGVHPATTTFPMPKEKTPLQTMTRRTWPRRLRTRLRR